MPRPLLIAAAIGLLMSATLAACGTDAGGAGDVPSATGAGTFPAKVEHKFGTTTVPKEPERVVVVGLTEQDTLLQLGVTPVAVTEWYGEQPYATWPWAQELLGDAKPKVLSNSDGIEFEEVIKLRPDLIVATNAGLEKKDYDTLAKIAPTVTSVKGSTQYFSSWRDQTLQIAKALGRESDGQELIDDVTDQYAKVAAAHPEWKGKSATFSQGAPYEGELYVYPDGLSTDFLTDLGFTITPGLAKYAAEDGAQAQISAENINLIDADVIVFATESDDMLKDLRKFPTFDTLKAVQQNRAAYTDGTLAGAIYFDTPLSLSYTLDKITPLLEKASEGQAPQAVPAA